VLFVSSLFLTRMEVYVGACVCVRPHTHSAYRVLGSEPRGRDKIPRGPEESKMD